MQHFKARKAEAKALKLYRMRVEFDAERTTWVRHFFPSKATATAYVRKQDDAGRWEGGTVVLTNRATGKRWLLIGDRWEEWQCRAFW